jgi:hypothetical protein
MSDCRHHKGAPEHADIRLKRDLADGWQPVGFQRAVAANGRTSDYSILLRNGPDLALYTTLSDGNRLYGSQPHLLTRDPE